MLHPASLLTAGIVVVFAVFLMLLQTLLTQRLSETRSLPDVAKASFAHWGRPRTWNRS